MWRDASGILCTVHGAVRATWRYGGGLNAQDAFALERGLMTFALRMRAHNENAQRLAEFLEEHPRVERVLYPGLPSHPAYAVAQQWARLSQPTRKESLSAIEKRTSKHGRRHLQAEESPSVPRESKPNPKTS